MTTTDNTRGIVLTGAGSGLGREMARLLLDRGHAVVLAGRRREMLAETAEERERAICVPCDVSDPAGVDRLFEVADERLDRLDVLVNNAGVFGPSGSVDELDLDAWDEVVATNLTGAMLCARAALRRMRSQSPAGGRIVNNGSISAHRPRPRSAAYTITKHAVTGLSRSIALDGRADGITCTQIDIGNAATAMTGGFVGTALQPDGTMREEPTFDARHVAEMVATVVELPNDVSVPDLTVHARGMPYAGRG